VNIAVIKQIFAKNKDEAEETQEVTQETEKARQELTDTEIRKLLRDELLQAGRFNRGGPQRQNHMSRFFK
ncbi:MAG: MerR family transcriptional regulator, partial [Bacillus sp. (in: firmicutes)]